MGGFNSKAQDQELDGAAAPKGLTLGINEEAGIEPITKINVLPNNSSRNNRNGAASPVNLQRANKRNNKNGATSPRINSFNVNLEKGNKKNNKNGAAAPKINNIRNLEKGNNGLTNDDAGSVVSNNSNSSVGATPDPIDLPMHDEEMAIEPSPTRINIKGGNRRKSRKMRKSRRKSLTSKK